MVTAIASTAKVIIMVEKPIITISRDILSSTIAIAEKKTRITVFAKREINVGFGTLSCINALRTTFETHDEINHPIIKINNAIANFGKNKIPPSSKVEIKIRSHA